MVAQRPGDAKPRPVVVREHHVQDDQVGIEAADVLLDVLVVVLVLHVVPGLGQDQVHGGDQVDVVVHEKHLLLRGLLHGVAPCSGGSANVVMAWASAIVWRVMLPANGDSSSPHGEVFPPSELEPALAEGMADDVRDRFRRLHTQRFAQQHAAFVAGKGAEDLLDDGDLLDGHA